MHENVRNTKYVLFLFWEKRKRLEPLELRLKRLSSGMTQEQLGSSAHRLRAKQVATLHVFWNLVAMRQLHILHLELKIVTTT